MTAEPPPVVDSNAVYPLTNLLFAIKFVKLGATLNESIPIFDTPSFEASPYVISELPPIAFTGIPPKVSPIVTTVTVKSAVPPSKSSNVTVSPAAYPWPGFTILIPVVVPIAPLAISTFIIMPVPLPVVELAVCDVYVLSLGEPDMFGLPTSNTEPTLSPTTPEIFTFELGSYKP